MKNNIFTKLAFLMKKQTSISYAYVFHLKAWKYSISVSNKNFEQMFKYKTE